MDGGNTWTSHRSRYPALYMDCSWSGEVYWGSEKKAEGGKEVEILIFIIMK